MMLNKKIILFCFIVLLSCKSNNKKFFYNYHDPKFSCNSSINYKNDEWLVREYFPIWEKFKQQYNIENSKIVKADVVIVGNSLVHLYPPEFLKNEFPNIEISLRGILGEITDLTIVRIKENVLSLNPKMVVIEIGGNDLIQGRCLSDIEKNIIKIIDIVHEYNSNIVIILTSLPPTGNFELNSISPIVNLFLMTQSQKQKKVYFIDLWAEMREHDKPIIKPEFTIPRDKIHFNINGYILWTKLLKPYISKL